MTSSIQTPLSLLAPAGRLCPLVTHGLGTALEAGSLPSVPTLPPPPVSPHLKVHHPLSQPLHGSTSHQPHQPAPSVLTGPQLPVHLQPAAGPIGAQIRGRLAGIGEQVWAGLERDVDVEGGRLVVTHNPFRHRDPSASQERVSDGPGCLRAVAGYKHPAALRVNFQHFVGNGDVWEVSKSGKERNQDGPSTLKLWFDNSSKI